MFSLYLLSSYKINLNKKNNKYNHLIQIEKLIKNK